MEPTVQAILAAAASFFFITLLFAAIVLICRTPKHRNRNRASRPNTRNLTQTRPASHPELSSIRIDESASFDPSVKSISMPDLAAATKNFSTELIIGDGSFGLVYKAKLSNGVNVAVKRLDPDAFQGFREFRAEMETLGKLRHRNIVRILGYCVSGDDRVLIYEFKEKGSLDQWLQDTSEEEVSVFGQSFQRLPLSWNTRMKIIRGVANGLSYLHSLDTPIIHRDIKASNVLLDFEFESYIADFGLARRIEHSHSHVSTQVAGTMGYMPPEYKEGITVATIKADVYSFGILMFEVATGRRPNLPVSFGGKVVGLVEWARKMVEENKEMEMVDPNISREGLNEEAVKELFKIACLCTSEYSRERPVMSIVVGMLTEVLFV